MCDTGLCLLSYQIEYCGPRRFGPSTSGCRDGNERGEWLGDWQALTEGRVDEV